MVRWQSKYGREPTIQQRAWLVSKVRSDIAMMPTKLNAQVIIKNLQNMATRTCWQFGGRNAASASQENVMEAGGEGEGG